MSETRVLQVLEAGEFAEGVPEGGRLVIFLAHDRTPRTLAVGCLVRTVAPGGEVVRSELVQLLAHSNGVRTCIELTHHETDQPAPGPVWGHNHPAPFSSAEFWTDDYAVGLRLEWEDGECIYCLNPSSSGDNPDVFLYRGTPEDGTPILHVNVGLSPKESDDA